MNRSSIRSALFIGAAFLLCASTRVAAATPAAAAPSAADPAIRSAIVAAVEKDRKLYGGRTPVPGVLVGVWDGSGRSYVHGFGDADLATKRPMTAGDHFRIGSNTKTFVVSVLLQLVDERKVKLDDPLSRFNVGVTVPNARNITLRQMCEMRSGLFEAYDSPEFSHMDVTGKMLFDPHTVIKWAIAQKPYFAPGKGYKYSNTNYLLLGLVIENVTKDTLGNEIRKRLIEPYKLTETSYPDTMAMPEQWAHGYGLDKQRNWEDVSGTIPVSLMGAAGEMVSDIADMKRWTTLYVTGKVNGHNSQSARMNCIPTGEGNLSFGLGIGCSAGWYGYTGGLPGYNTANYYFPASGVSIVAWVTLQAGAPPPGVANKIFRDIATLMTPGHVPFVLSSGAEKAKSGL